TPLPPDFPPLSLHDALPIFDTPGIKTYGSDLFVRDIAAKTERTIPDVSEFNLSRDGKTLVYLVASRKEETNGVFAINPHTGLSGDRKSTRLNSSHLVISYAV